MIGRTAIRHLLSDRVRVTPVRAQRGFSLVELMVALALGLIVSGGVITLFNATSRTSGVQNALGRVQENGRYAMVRFESDLRMAGAQFRRSSTGDLMLQTPGVGTTLPRTSPLINVNNFTLQDAGSNNGAPSTGTGWPINWPAGEPFPLAASMFLQGYECGTGTCTPAVPTGANGLPAVGTAAGSRVRGADVLTMRYQRGTGWKYTLPPGNFVLPGSFFTLVPVVGVDDTVNFGLDPLGLPDIALLSDCKNKPMAFRVTRAGNVLIPQVASMIDATKLVPGSGEGPCDPRIFNYSRDFVTVTYWLQLVADPNPSATPGRLISALVRRENGVDQQIVLGMERLDFLYAATNFGALTRYLDANQVQTGGAGGAAVANCPSPSDEYRNLFSVAPGTGVNTFREPNCWWRSVKAVEVHGLFNTIDDVRGLQAIDTAYWYGIDGGTTPVVPGATMPVSALPSRTMMRREFTTLASVRNNTN